MATKPVVIAEPSAAVVLEAAIDRPQSIGKKVLFFAVLVTSAVVAALAIFEVAVRLLVRDAGVTRPHSDRPAFYYAQEGSRVLHDYHYTREKPAGVFRVLAVGDSFTYPTFMQFDDAYPKRLERMLNLSAPQDRKLKAEVLSLGKKGESTKSEARFLKRAIKLNPDLVLLQITLNDPEQLTFLQKVQKYPGRYSYGELKITPENHPILNHWKSMAFLAKRIHNSRTLPSLIEYYQEMYTDPKSWKGFASALRAIKTITDNHNVKLAVVLFPLFYTELDDNYPFREVHQKIGGELAKLGVPILDLFEAFRGIPPQRLHVILGGDSHPNEIAHRIAAEHIYQWLEQQSLIPPELRIKVRHVQVPQS